MLCLVFVVFLGGASSMDTVQRIRYALDDARDMFEILVHAIQEPNKEALFNDLMRIPQSRFEEINMLVQRKGRDVLWPPDDQIPTSFDAREKWKDCVTIGQVQDQSRCISDWAVSVAQMLTDRYCIASNGAHQMRISAQYIMACLHERLRRGCFGGSLSSALQFINERGVPSGGAYGSHEGCMPYSMPPCNPYPSLFNTTNKLRVCDTMPEMYPYCFTACTNKRFKGNLTDDFRKFSSVYRLKNNGTLIKKDIMTYGPLVAQVDLHEDFSKYKGGIYNGSSEREHGRRREYNLKIFGWGVSNTTGQEYWLAMGSLNDFWGDQGTAKIQTNSEIIQLENYVHGALAAIEPKFWSLEYKKANVVKSRVRAPTCECDENFA